MTLCKFVILDHTLTLYFYMNIRSTYNEMFFCGSNEGGLRLTCHPCYEYLVKFSAERLPRNETSTPGELIIDYCVMIVFSLQTLA